MLLLPLFVFAALMALDASSSVEAFLLGPNPLRSCGNPAASGVGRKAADTVGRRRALPGLDPGAVDSANEVISSFAGGTVGCMGTLIALELAKQRVKEREGCPYCSGKGKLPCAQCYGSGVILVQTSQDGLRLSIPCQSCKGQRAVDCNICRGDGLSIPRLLEKKLSDVPEGQAQTESY